MRVLLRVSSMSGSVFFTWTAVHHKDLLTATTRPDSSCSSARSAGGEASLLTDSTHRLSFIYSKVPYWTCDRPPHQGDSVVTFLTLWVFLSFFQVKKFAEYLDPNAHGRINFKDFCHGVFAIKGKRTVFPRSSISCPWTPLMNLIGLDERHSKNIRLNISDIRLQKYSLKSHVDILQKYCHIFM